MDDTSTTTFWRYGLANEISNRHNFSVGVQEPLGRIVQALSHGMLKTRQILKLLNIVLSFTGIARTCRSAKSPGIVSSRHFFGKVRVKGDEYARSFDGELPNHVASRRPCLPPVPLPQCFTRGASGPLGFSDSKPTWWITRVSLTQGSGKSAGYVTKFETTQGPKANCGMQLDF